MRVSKKRDVWLNEILDAPASLFMQKGYEQTTINNIMNMSKLTKAPVTTILNLKKKL